MSQQQVWLTQDAYDRLRNEYEHLSGPGRAEIVSRINEAREEGDLKENGGYHAAKEEQGKQEARIRQLDELLRFAKVGETPANDGAVHAGMIVTVRFDDGDTERFLLGSREVSVGDLEVYSEKSPLGAAILDKRPGDDASYELPNGRQVKVTVVGAEPFTG
jgi:transcription elongation factor GreA